MELLTGEVNRLCATEEKCKQGKPERNKDKLPIKQWQEGKTTKRQINKQTHKQTDKKRQTKIEKKVEKTAFKAKKIVFRNLAKMFCIS